MCGTVKFNSPGSDSLSPLEVQSGIAKIESKGCHWIGLYLQSFSDICNSIAIDILISKLDF